jgi:hypothetical protein
MRALDIAVAEPRYKFLVYNTSVVFWRVSRPLQRHARFSHIIEPMQRVSDAIKELGAGDTEWKARFWIGLARAYDGCDQPDDAIRMLQVARTAPPAPTYPRPPAAHPSRHIPAAVHSGLSPPGASRRWVARAAAACACARQLPAREAPTRLATRPRRP